VAEADGALSALEAGIAGTGRELKELRRRSTIREGESGAAEIPSGRSDRPMLRAMEVNVASIRDQLAMIEACTRRAFLDPEGEPAPETARPRPQAGRTVVAHRLGAPRVERGTQGLPASPCMTLGTNGTTTVHIFSDAGHCARVEPGERLRFVNDTGIGPRHTGEAAIRVLAGGYELWIEPGGSGVIPAPVGTYLGRGSHPVRVAGAPGPTILVLPPNCAIRPPAESGEELCFR
jgi:hypothetical protein